MISATTANTPPRNTATPATVVTDSTAPFHPDGSPRGLSTRLRISVNPLLRGPGVRANPTTLTRKAATSVHSSGLHRRDGTRPSGNRRNRSGSERTTAGAPTLFTQAEKVAAGSGRTASSRAYRAYTPPSPEKAKTNATQLKDRKSVV